MFSMSPTFTPKWPLSIKTKVLYFDNCGAIADLTKIAQKSLNCKEKAEMHVLYEKLRERQRASQHSGALCVVLTHYTTYSSNTPPSSTNTGTFVRTIDCIYYWTNNP